MRQTPRSNPIEAFVGFEDMVRALYKQIAIITIELTWVKLIDFEETLPQAISELVQQGQSTRTRDGPYHP